MEDSLNGLIKEVAYFIKEFKHKKYMRIQKNGGRYLTKGIKIYE